MEQKTLMRFIRRIIDTSPDSSSAGLALSQLKAILSEELSKEDLKLLEAAYSGVQDQFSVMKEPNALFSPEILRASAERAREMRIRAEMASRQGRC